MAKKPGGSRERIKNSQALVPTKGEANNAAVLANAPAAVKAAVKQSCADKTKAEKAVAKSEGKFQKFVGQTMEAAKTETGVEIVGGLSAQAFNELGNLGLRTLGEWSEKTAGPDGFWTKNVDLTQSIPGAIGTVIYVLEKALRPEFDPQDKDAPPDKRRPYMPKAWRRGVSEASKVAAHLGLSNTIRALRFRWAESIDERHEKEMAIADRDRLLQQARDELEQVKAQVRQLQAKAAGGGR